MYLKKNEGVNMKKITLFILLGLGLGMGSSSYAQSSWSFLQNKNLSAGIGIQSSDASLNINFLKKEERNQVLLISKKDMDCLICSMTFNFGNRNLNTDVEFLYKTPQNEFVYAVLNKVGILRGFSYSSSFAVKNAKTGIIYNFSGNAPVKFFNNSDFTEWQNQVDNYQTDSLNYYVGKGKSIIYATLAANQRIKNIQTLTFTGLNLNCNPGCDMITYFSSGQATYKLIREDNLGKITYRLPQTFIQDMKSYNRAKDSFAVKVNSVEKGDIIFKFDSSSYAPLIY